LWADPKKESANYFPNLVILVRFFLQNEEKFSPE